MENVFALDIGTRKIVGLVMQQNSEGYVVLASETREHKTRAMLDGQIHDVEAVANTIKEIKDNLEERLNLKLHKVAVAAAGRALLTSKGSAMQHRLIPEEISREEVLALEIEAVQQAQFTLAQNNSSGRNDYFCVGYSVISYFLNDQKIGNLIGQTANKLAVEVIATFLPRVVVDSLFSALRRVDLEIYSLTLEPIAALSVAIPPNMRLLNLALVDIGAGTSDIAVVKNGNIFAYAMVPMAGDKLTEFLAERYLLDFNTAEVIKRQLGSTDVVEISDILGNKEMVRSEQIIKEMQTITSDIVSNIAQNILELNQKTPDAVVLIGGGSLTPGLPAVLAENLNLPSNRVGLRNPESLGEITIDSEFLKGPQGVTPLGIAYNCFLSPPIPFIKVKVNGREVALWNGGNITVAQALLSSGIALNNIYGKPGLGKTIEVNGVVKSYKGEMGTQPIIKVNNKDANLDDLVQDNDIIDFIKGEDGKEPCIKVKDLIPDNFQGYVFINDEKLELKPMVVMNGQMVSLDEEIPDRAKVEFKRINSIYNILLLHGVPENYLVEKSYKYYLNNKQMYLKWRPIEVWKNNQLIGLDETVELNSKLYYTFKSLKPKVKDVIKNLDTSKINVFVNGNQVTLETSPNRIICNGKIVKEDEEIYDNMRLEYDTKQNSAILSDIFKVVNIDTSSAGRLKILVDGEPAGFTTPIYDNSKIELVWEK